MRLLTDPTFDPPGDYPIGQRRLVKTAGPTIGIDALGSIDVVLLSHDQHPDNLDHLGREYLNQAELVLSTASARQRLEGPVRALPYWDQLALPRPNGATLRITGVPAQHGPEGTEHLTGEVTGFVMSGDDTPTIYISGDNASPEVVHAIAERFGPVELALRYSPVPRRPRSSRMPTSHPHQRAGCSG